LFACDDVISFGKVFAERILQPTPVPFGQPCELLGWCPVVPLTDLVVVVIGKPVLVAVGVAVNPSLLSADEFRRMGGFVNEYLPFDLVNGTLNGNEVGKLVVSVFSGS